MQAMKYIPIATLLSLSIFAAPAMAAPIDVPSDAWFSPTVSNFIDAGYFDGQKAFRPEQKATRGEFIELLVNMLGGPTHAPFSEQSFDDVSKDHPLFDYFEEAGLQGWMKGSGSCYGSHPCFANPNNPINRAEAAALLIRAFSLKEAGEAPTFEDNPAGNWFTDPIRAAASLCILRGDAEQPRVRPADNMNRAEMVAMAERVLMHLSYPSCSTNADITLPKAPSATDGNGAKTYIQCTANAWKCVPSWCATGGTAVAGTCALVDLTCLNPESAKPDLSLADCSPASQSSSSFNNPSLQQSTISCASKPKSCLQSNLDYWTEARKPLTAKMEKMSTQTVSGCMSTLALIETDYVNAYNNYISIYENFNNGGNWNPAINNIEFQMRDIIKRIDAAPSYCY